MAKAEQGLGTVRRIFNRGGKVVWWQALLPRHLSVAPVGCKRPARYQQPLAEKFTSEDDARAVLIAAIAELRKSPLRNALGFDAFVAAEIQAREHAAWRRYNHKAKARSSSATWRSIEKHWLAKAPFYRWQPAAIPLKELQAWFDLLEQRATGKRGRPLSASFIHQVRELVRAVLDRAGVDPNPAERLRLPAKPTPRVPFLDLAAQRRFYGSATVELEDRVRVGCGQGAGLRVGELLSLEAVDLHLREASPYLMVRHGGQHAAPTKGNSFRRVELYEPGLGFFRLHMKLFYRGGQRVFEGPEGGFPKHWPELFPEWAAVAGVHEMTSHIMRHTWAVSMLSGSWGYDPQSLEFVQKQLGHKERSTTERYYGAFEAGVWEREVARMTGAAPRAARPVVTAAELLGLAPGIVPADSGADGAFDGEESGNRVFLATTGTDGSDPRHSPRNFAQLISAAASGPPEEAHQARRLLIEGLAAAGRGDARAALTLLVTGADLALQILPAEPAAATEHEERAGAREVARG